MQGVPSRYIVIGAGGILAAGVCWAGALLMTPPAKEGDTQRIRELAQRVSTEPVTDTPLTVPADPTFAPAVAPPVQPRVTTTPAPAAGTSSAAKPGVAVQKPVASTSRPSPTPTVTPQPAPREDPVKNIALMGVTHDAGRDSAWMYDLQSQSRETVREGDRAFGFTVRRIQPEAVVLVRGTDEYTVRLGDKQIPVNDAQVASAESGNGFNRFGPGGEGFRGRGRDGGGDGDREARRAAFMARFGQGGGPGGFSGRRFGGDGNFGGGNFGGGNTSFSSGDDNSSRGDGGRRFNSDSGSSGRGSFQAPIMSFPFGMGGNFGGRSSTNSYSTPAATSNPQTARRRGGQLVGGASTADSPDTITNPQTQRRLGNTSGPAFGQEQTTRGGTTGRTTNTGRNNTR